MGRKGKEVVDEGATSRSQGRATRASTRNPTSGSYSQRTQREASGSRQRQIPIEETHPQPSQGQDIPKHHLDNTYNITFDGNEQKEKYDVMFERGLISTRFLDDTFMCELGLNENLEWMFERLGLSKLWGARYSTYPKYVLEFLSSVEVRNRWAGSPTQRGLEFRLNGQNRIVDANDISLIYGFHKGGLKKQERDIKGSEFWPRISDEDKFEPGHSKCSAIRNPVFRCFQKAIANTILARGDSQNVMRTEEIYFIWACFECDEQIDMGYHFLNQIKSIAKRTKGPINIGGMLTPLFLHFGVDLSRQETAPGSNILGFDIFHASGLFSRRGSAVYLNDPYILLPCYSRIDVSDESNWKVGELTEDDDDEMVEADDDEEEEEEEEQQEENIGVYNFGEIQNSIREIRDEQRQTNATLQQFGERQQRLEERFNMMYQWNEAIYHHFFPPPPPPPTA